MTLQRVQLFLTQEQYRRLKYLARVRQTSVSAVVREILEHTLPPAVGPTTEWMARTREVSQKVLAARGGKPLPVDIVELIRTMREERAHALAPWIETSNH